MSYELFAKNNDDFSDFSAQLIETSIHDILKKKSLVVMAIPGGRSAAQIFKKLLPKEIPWGNVHIFMADERLVPIESNLSNYKIAKDFLIDPLSKTNKLPPANVHPFIITKPHISKAINNYQNELDLLGGVCDLLLLSVGEDGHICSLFPNHASIVNNSKEYISVKDSPKKPSARMSLSKNQVMEAHTSILLFQGASKKKAFDNFQNETISELACPAKLVKSNTNTYIVTNI